MNEEQGHSGDGTSAEITGTSAATSGVGEDSHSAGNGKDITAEGNGRDDPFADVHGDHDGDDADWKSELPTEGEIKAKPSSIYAPTKLRALAKQRDTNREGYVDLICQLVTAAADDPEVTSAKVRDAVEEQARKDRKEAKAAAAGEANDESHSTADQLVRQVADMVAAGRVTIGHTEDGAGFARCPVDNAGKTIIATYPIGAPPFRSWLRRRYYADTKKSLRRDALDQVVSTIAAIAEVEGEKIGHLFVRVAAHDGKHYLDLGTPDWSAIEIGPGLGTNGCGWQVVSTSPVWFVRSATMRPLPMPVPGGSIEELRPFLNVSNDDNDDGFVLSVGHCIGSLNPDGPFGILLGVGPWNAAKSTWLSVLRRLVDPNHADRRAPPATVLDLLRNAQRTWAQSFDNVTSFKQEMCDAFCRMSTGGGDVVRKLFTDDGEIIFESRRPIIMTSTLDAVTRPDMLSRTLIVTLSFIEEDKMKTERRFWGEFEEAQPRILGALLTAVAHGLAQPPVDRADLPRLADFADWVTRCEGGLGWKPNTFLNALRNNAAISAQDALDNDPLAGALRDMLQREPAQPDGSTSWEGLVSALQKKICNAMGDYAYRAANLPRLPHHFSGRLRQVAPLLARVGITLTRKHSNKGSSIFIGTMAQQIQRETPHTPIYAAKRASPASPASPTAAASTFSVTYQDNGGDAHAEAEPVPQEGASPKSDAQRVGHHLAKPGKAAKSDASDAGDAHSAILRREGGTPRDVAEAGPDAEELL